MGMVVVAIAVSFVVRGALIIVQRTGAQAHGAVRAQ